ncbi:hypothetical protein SKAU_G00229550 [Synaphobranchus kaupii]|uniref:Uncharacterized protein n=1 Tax=Synaphobranchus kaupii TaxID=118154 RepID=A0A9Q1F5R9_SYNKA|nr:hypothetical protein SKAU_G00229550 [Synaphobranchus kaupii]
MVDNHGLLPTKAIREEYALGIVMLFPSLKDPYSKKGYEPFYDAASSTGYISWRLKTVQRKARQGSALPPNGSTDLSPGEFRRLVQSAESPTRSDLNEPTTYDQGMASLLLLLHLLPPPPGGPKSPKISASDAVERLVVFHKSCCSLEEHLCNHQGRQPYLLAVGCQKSKIDSFYIAMDKHLIPCQANRSLWAFDELFQAHFVFNLSYDVALVNFYTNPADNTVQH